MRPISARPTFGFDPVHGIAVERGEHQQLLELSQALLLFERSRSASRAVGPVRRARRRRLSTAARRRPTPARSDAGSFAAAPLEPAPASDGHP